MDNLRKIIVSLLGVGYIRPISATWGSLASGIVLYFFWPSLDIWIKGLVIIVTFTLGCILSNQIERIEKIHDPSFIVIDELVGMMIVSILLTQVWWHWVIAFVLFRIFDVAKLWPASTFDKKKGGFSIMFDDVLMSLPALIILELILMWI